MSDIIIKRGGVSTAYSINPGASVATNIGNFTNGISFRLQLPNDSLDIEIQDAAAPSGGPLDPNISYAYEVLFVSRIRGIQSVLPVNGVHDAALAVNGTHSGSIGGATDGVTLRMDRLADTEVGRRFMLTFSA